jgi:hypothetical protein
MVAGRYLLQATIGRGAMGTVWRARDTVLARDVAVKEVRLRGPQAPGSALTEETRVLYERTLREARTAARLNHPAVVTIFDVVEADGSPWIVMELVEARSLDQVLTEEGPLRPHQAADLGARVLGALACAHAAGILHRDVKPSNVLLGPDGRAVLTDFGIATLEGDSGLTQAGMVMGTPGFTAPERIRGVPASPASDLWSLGATLYAAVEGRGPFDNRGNSIAILAAIANEEAPRPRSAGPLRPVIEALLHRNPQARPDAAAVGRLLAAAGLAAGLPGGSGAATSGEAGQHPAGAVAPLLTAPLDLALAGPQTRAPAGGVSRDGAPRPDSQQAGALWPAGPRPHGTRSAGPRSAGPRPGGPGPDGPRPDGPPPGNTPPDGPGAAFPGPESPRGPAAGLRAAALRAAGPQAGRHGAGAPGLRSGLAAELAATLPRGRRGLLALLGALAIVGAGILAGVALTRGSGGPPAPAGTAGPQAVTAGQAGSAAGFTMTVPAGWQTSRLGPSTDFTSPAGRVSILVTPAAADGVTAAGQLRRQLAVLLKQGRFPGYQPVGGRPFAFRGGAGAAWQFTWQPVNGGRMEALEIAFRITTAAGSQAYLVRESAPVTGWVAAQPVFRNALGTFRTRS